MLKVFKSEQLALAIAKEMLLGLEVENPVFCLASGSTPAKSYDIFAKEVMRKGVALDKLRIVSLDEWVGVEKSNVGSCYQMLNQDLFLKMGLDAKQVIFYDGMASDLEAEGARIDDFIKQNPITFSLMGVGMNGHIGLNEPGFPSRLQSSVVTLSDTTRKVAQKYFKEETELSQGITLGLGQIIESKRVIVAVTGAHKAAIMKEIFSASGHERPAGQLLNYTHIDFYLDEEAAKYL